MFLYYKLTLHLYTFYRTSTHLAKGIYIYYALNVALIYKCH